MIGYDFVGPRVELEGVYRNNTGNVRRRSVQRDSATTKVDIGVMANVLYDFNAGG